MCCQWVIHLNDAQFKPPHMKAPLIAPRHDQVVRKLCTAVASCGSPCTPPRIAAIRHRCRHHHAAIFQSSPRKFAHRCRPGGRRFPWLEEFGEIVSDLCTCGAER